MTRRYILGMAVFAAMAFPTYAGAHEGHVRKLTGTLVLRDANRLEVKTTDGKTATITLNEKTKTLRGKVRVKVEQITDGERAVVTATETKGKDGKVMLVATEIRLGATNATASKPRTRAF